MAYNLTMASAFNSQGSTPAITWTDKYPTTSGTTPASKALVAAGSGGPVPSNPATPYNANIAPAPTNTATPYNASIAPTTSGLIPKSQTVTQADGSSHTVTYHPPEQTTASATVANGGRGTSSSLYNPKATAGQAGSLDPTLSTTGTSAPSVQGNGGSSAATPTYAGLLGQLATTSSSPIQGYLDQVAQANAYNEALKKSRMNEAAGLAANAENPIPLPFQQGRAQVLQSQYAQEQAALGSAYQGASNLVGAANTQQGLQQSGLTSALNAAAPQANFPFVFNPVTQSFSVSGGNLQGAITSGVQQAVSNPALYTSIHDAIQSTYGAASAGMFQQAYIQAGGNPQTAAASGTAAASNVQAGGTASTNAAVQGYSQAVQDYGNMTATNNAADAQISQVQNVLQSTGLNQGIPDANKAINTLQTKLGGTSYTQLTTAITELQNIYSQLLSAAGTTPSGSESQALALLNPNSSADQIRAAIGQLQTAAFNRLQAQYGKMQTFQQNIGAPNTSNQTSNVSSNPPGWF